MGARHCFAPGDCKSQQQVHKVGLRRLIPSRRRSALRYCRREFYSPAHLDAKLRRALRSTFLIDFPRCRAMLETLSTVVSLQPVTIIRSMKR